MFDTFVEHLVEQKCTKYTYCTTGQSYRHADNYLKNHVHNNCCDVLDLQLKYQVVSDGMVKPKWARCSVYKSSPPPTGLLVAKVQVILNYWDLSNYNCKNYKWQIYWPVHKGYVLTTFNRIINLIELDEKDNVRD